MLMKSAQYTLAEKDIAIIKNWMCWDIVTMNHAIFVLYLDWQSLVEIRHTNWNLPDGCMVKFYPSTQVCLKAFYCIIVSYAVGNMK